MIIFRALAPVFVVALLAGCAAPQILRPSADATQTESVASTSTGDGCLDVPDAITEQIASGANDLAITIENAAAVQHPNEPEFFVVAADFTTAGSDKPETGVWMVSSLEGSGLTLAVDGFAQQFTDWPGQMNGHEFSVTEPGVAEAKTCLRAQ